VGIAFRPERDLVAAGTLLGSKSAPVTLGR
jgi:hypothetical protein